MEVLRGVRPVQCADGIGNKIPQRLIHHRMTEHVVQYFANEEGDGPFARIGDDGLRNKCQLGRAHGTVVGGQLKKGERGVFAGSVLASQTVHPIINSPARTRVGVQEVRFVRLRLQRQDNRVSRA